MWPFHRSEPAPNLLQDHIQRLHDCLARQDALEGLVRDELDSMERKRRQIQALEQKLGQQELEGMGESPSGPQTPFQLAREAQRRGTG